jgi:hypothetical protein
MSTMRASSQLLAPARDWGVARRSQLRLTAIAAEARMSVSRLNKAPRGFACPSVFRRSQQGCKRRLSLSSDEDRLDPGGLYCHFEIAAADEAGGWPGKPETIRVGTLIPSLALRHPCCPIFLRLPTCPRERKGAMNDAQYRVGRRVSVDAVSRGGAGRLYWHL